MANPTLQQYIEQQNNPWTKASPTNSDYFQMITQQNMRDGMPQDVAEANAVQEMQGYMKDGINPMGPINGREAGYNESQGAGQANQMQQGAALDKTTRLNQALTNEQGQSFGDWRVQQELQRQAAVKAQDTAMGRAFGQAIIGNRSDSLRGMSIADDSQGVIPPTFKR